MSRPWTDPRDGTTWLVDTMPFDLGSAEERSLIGWTMLFVSNEGHRKIPVGHDLGVNMDKLKDRELIALLDAASVEGG